MQNTEYSSLFGNSADVVCGLASCAHKEDVHHALISGLDADGRQAGDGHMHSKECTSGDQKPGHPRFSAGKAFSALGPRWVVEGGCSSLPCDLTTSSGPLRRGGGSPLTTQGGGSWHHGCGWDLPKGSAGLREPLVTALH